MPEESNNKPISTLELRWADRVVRDSQTPRRFLEFVVDGEPLSQQLNCEGQISQLGYLPNSQDEGIVRKLLLLDPPDLFEGRQALYVCPECAYLDCGAITAVISRQHEHLVWENFAYYNTFNVVDNYVSETPIIAPDDYVGVGPFFFDAVTYAEVLQTGLGMIADKPHPQ